MTTQTPTQEQIRTAWNTIADNYDQHVTPHNAELGEYALGCAGLHHGQRFLDVASGSGALSLPAARLGADVVATDIAPTMVERLRDRAKAEGLSIDARIMDGSSLDLDDATFDVSGSQHGVSLFPDLARGLAEMVRVTKPAGRVLLVAFGAFAKVEFIGMFMGALRAAVPGFEPPALPAQVSDPDVLREQLSSAGLTDVSVDTITWEQHFESVTQYWNMITASNPIARQALSQATEAQVSDVRRVLEGLFRERSDGKPSATLHAEINIGVGTK
jgi:ubiquinone/menaquinone biosynthesis C-methylase UbiE